MPKPVYRDQIKKKVVKKKKTTKKKTKKTVKKKVVCIACGDTKINSKGGACVPCLQRSYMK